MEEVSVTATSNEYKAQKSGGINKTNGLIYLQNSTSILFLLLGEGKGGKPHPFLG